MGKCILAGHPPVDGQIGYGTYTGNGAASRTISLGVTPKWVLVFDNGYLVYNSGLYGGLAINGSPAGPSGMQAVIVVSGGFQVFYDTNRSVRSNASTDFYNYIYGT